MVRTYINNYKLDVNARYKNKTPLMVAASHMEGYGEGYLKSFYILKDAGADINAQDDDGNTMLIRAVIKQDIFTIRRLLESGINIFMSNKKGNNALDLACTAEKNNCSFGECLHENIL